jgi:tetratricopeptide (TPR) repeat protein
MAAANKNIGNSAEAENLLLQALKMNPMNPTTNGNLLALYASTNNLVKAEQMMQDINTKKLDHPDISFAQGIYYIKLQKFEDAKIAIEKGLVQSPDNTSALANLAKIYYLQGNINKTIELYEKFLSLNPDDALISAFVGSLYLNNIKNKNKALQYLKQALEIDPQNADADKWRAIISQIEKTP